MTIPSNSITNFRANVTASNGFQHAGMYKCQMSSGAGYLQSYPLDITLPQRTFDLAPFSNWGPESNLQVRRNYGECSMTFIIMQDWNERLYIEKWMDNILPVAGSDAPSAPGLSFLQRAFGRLAEPFTSGGGDSSKYADYSTGYGNSAGTISIDFLNSQNRTFSNATMILYDVFPQTITPTTFSSTPDYGLATFVAIFNFREYEIL
jgi:hypothetical protein